MTDTTASGKPEGEAFPALKRIERVIEADAERVLAAVEAWYAAHFHRHTVAGTAPITADDKAALIQHVADAVAPTADKE